MKRVRCSVLAAKVLPAAFRRLCVETSDVHNVVNRSSPAAFRRLCVETTTVYVEFPFARASRLQAAVC